MRKIRPVVISAEAALRRGWRLRRIAIQPAFDVVMIRLAVPKQSGEGLALHVDGISAHTFAFEAHIEFVRFLFSLLEDAVEVRVENLGRRDARWQPLIGEQQPLRDASAGWNFQLEMCGYFRPRLRGIHRVEHAVDNVIIDPVLYVLSSVLRIEQAL